MFGSDKAAHISSEEVQMERKHILSFKKLFWDFPGGAVVKNPPASAGDMDSSPGPGRSHMLRDMQLSPCATTTEPVL